MLGEPDQFIRQQLQGPTGATLRRVRTGGGDEQSFLFAGKLTVRSGARFFVERRLKVAEHEAALGPAYGRTRQRRHWRRSPRSLHRRRHLCGEQNLRPA